MLRITVYCFLIELYFKLDLIELLPIDLYCSEDVALSIRQANADLLYILLLFLTLSNTTLLLLNMVFFFDELVIPLYTSTVDY